MKLPTGSWGDPQAQPTAALAGTTASRAATTTALALATGTFSRRSCLDSMVVPLPGVTETELAEIG